MEEENIWLLISRKLIKSNTQSLSLNQNTFVRWTIARSELTIFLAICFTNKKKILEAVSFLEKKKAIEKRSIQLGSSWLEFRGHVFLQMASGYLYFENFSNSAASNVVETWNPQTNMKTQIIKVAIHFTISKMKKKGRQFLLTLQCEIFQCCHDSQTTNYNCKLQNKCYTEWKLQNFYIP